VLHLEKPACPVYVNILLVPGPYLCIALQSSPLNLMHALQERASGMYRLSAFYFARTASDLPIDCTIPTCFIIIVYFMGGLRYSHCLSCTALFISFLPCTCITCVFPLEQVCRVLNSFLREILF